MRRAWWLALCLVGCAPRTSPAGPHFLPGDAALYARLIAPFGAALAQAGVHLTRATPYRSDGADPNAFQRATALFYQLYPGFCPAQGGFLTDPGRPVFLTLAVRGREVRAFVYDQSKSPRLSFAFAEGVSDQALPRGVCPPEVGR